MGDRPPPGAMAGVYHFSAPRCADAVREGPAAFARATGGGAAATTRLGAAFPSRGPVGPPPRAGHKRKRDDRDDPVVSEYLDTLGLRAAGVRVDDGRVAGVAGLVLSALTDDDDLDARDIGAYISDAMPTCPARLAAVPRTADMGALLDLAVAQDILRRAYAHPVRAWVVTTGRGEVQRVALPSWVPALAQQLLLETSRKPPDAAGETAMRAS
jgi:hypothetical protein